jgi:hypothetical protein
VEYSYFFCYYEHACSEEWKDSLVRLVVRYLHHDGHDGHDGHTTNAIPGLPLLAMTISLCAWHLANQKTEWCQAQGRCDPLGPDLAVKSLDDWDHLDAGAGPTLVPVSRLVLSPPESMLLFFHSPHPLHRPRTSVRGFEKLEPGALKDRRCVLPASSYTPRSC